MKWNQRHYILNEQGNPVAASFEQWLAWFDNADRHVGWDEIDGVRVSTVFLGLDHNFSEEGPPILWESMTFPSKEPVEVTMPDGSRRVMKNWIESDCERCSGSREQAEAMHARMVAKVEAQMKKRLTKKD